MTIIDTLKSLGLDEKQTKVYLACLELGTGTIHDVSQKSGIKRTSIYNFLDDLKQKGVISEVIEKNKITLVAVDPNSLVLKAEKQFEDMKKILPELMGIYNLPSNKPKVRFYEGIDGIKNAYEDMVQSGEDIYGYSDYDKMFTTMPNEYLWTIPEGRVKRKMKFFCIAKDGLRGREVKSMDTKQLRETKLVKDVEFDTEINIYGNKVAMFSFRRPGAAVIIEDGAIATTFKTIWRVWWKTLPY